MLNVGISTHLACFSGGRKGNQGLVVFDLYQRCFTREIPIFCEGMSCRFNYLKAFKMEEICLLNLSCSFSNNFHLFLRIIFLISSGTLKFLFALKCPSSSGGSSLVVACTASRYGQTGVSCYFFAKKASQKQNFGCI